ncbi:ATPase [Sphingomonas sp.]|jgi:F-type H+-transporting ATPase subunit b|uniref:F0F1 ATP synthase subunit B family protein n=1 Tax=Sphingomonas sp. TaxID=28214 RepID=UPI002D7FA5F9|nr:ATPase [Sphingomonas sp.]HEU0044092.1 ATPase [Sphingomonas sp.]
MPQISQLAATYASQIFWLLLTFGLVFLVVGRGMLPRVQKTIADRDAGIQGDLAAAAAARDAADRAEDQWKLRDQANRERAQALLAEARGKAAKASEATLAAANAQQAEKVGQAETSIREATARAVAEIESVAAEAAQAIVARVSGAQVSADEARAAVQKVLHV